MRAKVGKVGIYRFLTLSSQGGNTTATIPSDASIEGNCTGPRGLLLLTRTDERGRAKKKTNTYVSKMMDRGPGRDGKGRCPGYLPCACSATQTKRRRSGYHELLPSDRRGS